MNKTDINPKIKFTHNPAAAISAGYIINDADNTVTAAFAFTNVQHDTFDRAKGRQIIAGRIAKGGVNKRGHARSVTFPLADVGGSTKYRDLSAHVMRLASDEITSRVEKKLQ